MEPVMPHSLSSARHSLMLACLLICPGCDGASLRGPGGTPVQGVGAGRSTPQTQAAARAQGVAGAEQSIAAGVLLWKEYPPLPAPPWHAEYIRLLRDRLQVAYEVPRLPPGTDESDFLAKIRGWNDTMNAEIDRRHGPETLSKLHTEAMSSRRPAGGPGNATGPGGPFEPGDRGELRGAGGPEEPVEPSDAEGPPAAIDPQPSAAAREE